MEKLDPEIISRIAHDLKSPLASVQDGLALLAAGKLGELTPAQQEIVTLSRRNVGRAASRIAKLFEWFRLEQGLTEFEKRPHDLAALTESAIQALRRERTGILLEWERPSAPVMAACDASRTRQMIDELLDNAAVFSPPEKPIAVRLEREAEDSWVQLSVENSCASLNLPEDAGQEPFYPLRTGRQHAAQGLGLGLPIVRAIVRAQGGEFFHRRLDQGVLFGVRLRS